MPLPFRRAMRLGRLGSDRDDLRGNPFLVEHAFDVLGDDVLVAGRVARVDAQHRLVMPHRLGLESLVQSGSLRRSER